MIQLLLQKYETFKIKLFAKTRKSNYRTVVQHLNRAKKKLVISYTYIYLFEVEQESIFLGDILKCEGEKTRRQQNVNIHQDKISVSLIHIATD